MARNSRHEEYVAGSWPRHWSASLCGVFVPHSQITAHTEIISFSSALPRSRVLGDEAGAAFASRAGCRAFYPASISVNGVSLEDPSAQLHAARTHGWINV